MKEIKFNEVEKCQLYEVSETCIRVCKNPAYKVDEEVMLFTTNGEVVKSKAGDIFGIDFSYISWAVPAHITAYAMTIDGARQFLVEDGWCEYTYHFCDDLRGTSYFTSIEEAKEHTLKRNPNCIWDDVKTAEGCKEN